MPVVPRVEGPSVALQAAPNAYQSAAGATPDAFGGGRAQLAGQAAQALGQRIGPGGGTGRQRQWGGEPLRHRSRRLQVVRQGLGQVLTHLADQECSDLRPTGQRRIGLGDDAGQVGGRADGQTASARIAA